MKVLSSITDTQDAVNKEYIDGLLAEYTKTANLGALASKNSLAFSELTSKPTTLSGYGITDVYSKTESDGRYFPLAGNKTITGSVSIEGEIKGKAISNPTNASVTNQWRIIRAGDALYLQVGTDAGDTAGTLHLTGYSGVAASHIRLHTAKATITGEIEVTGATSLYSTLSVTGTATLSGGAFLPPTKTIRFQDAATETFAISFDSEAGGLNLSGATRTLGLASFSKGIQIEYGQSIAFVDSSGVKHYITLDEENGAIKVIGNFFATGQNAAGGFGEVTGESGGGVANVEIKVNALSAYDGRTITTTAMQTLTGLSVDVAQSMLEGAYNKVIDNSGDYPSVWEYTAYGTSTGIEVLFRQGDGFNIENGYSLTYTTSSASWSIIMGEI